MNINKFKVWCKDYNEWEKDDVALLPNGIIMQKVLGRWNIIRPQAHITVFYTGRNDKKGVEIYEGDICKFEFEKGDRNIRIIFKNCAFRFMNDDCRLIVLSNFNLNYIEVIGNNFENPELLKL